jgi:hypothetical protein
MHLYKYVNEPKYILEEGYIRATQLSALNDPFEANYSKKELKYLAKEFNDYSDKKERKKLVKYVEENISKVGIISFTESKDNLLMWAHYANEHKGALIGFLLHGNSFKNLFSDGINTVFDENFDYYNGVCHPVIYRKQPLYNIDKFDRDYSNISMEGYDRLVHEILLQKSDEWIYEKEHRIILKLSQADKVILEDFDKYKNIDFIDNMLNSDIFDEKPIVKKEGKELHIYLEQMKVNEDRCLWGDGLANLARNNPQILFLFKLHPNSISSLTYGIRAEKKEKYFYPNSRFFEIFKTKLNKKNYTLKFKQLN